MNKYFVLAPREMSQARIKSLLKKYLPRGKVTFGIAHEKYIAGFENQPQFKTLQGDFVKNLAAKSGGRLTVVEYPQSDGVDMINQLDFNRAIIINGSFHRSFHLRPECDAIISKGAEIRYESPFVDEQEAKDFADKVKQTESRQETSGREDLLTDSRLSDPSLQEIIKKEASKAFITDFQTAAAVVKDNKIIALAHNTVVPYETYAWHHGLEREKHKSPPGDSSKYDTVHAETAALMEAGPKAKGATLYMQTFPCPHCAKNILYAGIKEVVYELDYGDDYGYNLFSRAGIKYRRYNE
ncbi:deaminase [Candidatus Saccharibacteria bacterium]|nr:deaminase [Candidatus Saccharibacteria bacterium]